MRMGAGFSDRPGPAGWRSICGDHRGSLERPTVGLNASFWWLTDRYRRAGSSRPHVLFAAGLGALAQSRVAAPWRLLGVIEVARCDFDNKLNSIGTPRGRLATPSTTRLESLSAPNTEASNVGRRIRDLRVFSEIAFGRDEHPEPGDAELRDREISAGLSPPKARSR